MEDKGDVISPIQDSVPNLTDDKPAGKGSAKKEPAFEFDVLNGKDEERREKERDE